MGTTQKVAKYVVDFSIDQMTAREIQQVKTSILDTIGVVLVGSKGPVGTIMTDYIKLMGGNPHARLLGSGIKTSVVNAVLANGTFAHADDYDAHPHTSILMLPPALALGEYLKLSGKKILEAYAVGWEIRVRINNSLGNVQFKAGYHSTPLHGTVAAAVEAAKLMGLSVDETRAAMGISASMACGIMQNFGTHTKPLHGGHASSSGVKAALLASKGFTGDPDVLEGRRGYFYVYGQQQADIRRLAETLGKVPLAIADENAFCVKRWPNCYANHPPIAATFTLIEKYDVKPEQIEAIEVLTFTKPPAALIRTNPQRGYEGKFSMQHSIATALVDRKVDLNSYTDEKLSRPIMQQLIKRMTVRQHPDTVDLPLSLFWEYPFQGVIITLKMNDGRVLTEREDHEHELKGKEILDKYQENCKIAGVNEKNMKRSMELVQGLEDVKDVTELVETVC
jgi:2-methylcitrate dehydratase PrpD